MWADTLLILFISICTALLGGVASASEPNLFQERALKEMGMRLANISSNPTIDQMMTRQPLHQQDYSNADEQMAETCQVHG